MTIAGDAAPRCESWLRLSGLVSFCIIRTTLTRRTFGGLRGAVCGLTCPAFGRGRQGFDTATTPAMNREPTRQGTLSDDRWNVMDRHRCVID